MTFNKNWIIIFLLKIKIYQTHELSKNIHAQNLDLRNKLIQAEEENLS